MRSPYIVRRPAENIYLVRRRDRRRRRELVGVATAVVLVAAGLLAYTSIHVEMLSTGYRIDELSRELHRLQQEERHRQLQISRLTGPEHLENRARRELEMEYPTLEQAIFRSEVAR